MHRTHTSVAAVPDIVFVKDLEGRYLMANQAAAAIVGLTPEDLVGKLDVDVLPAEVAAEQRGYDREVARRGEPITFEGPLLTAAGGEPHTMRTTKAPLRNADGTVFGVIGVTTDISALRGAEDALHRTEALLRRVGDLTGVGVWEWELAGDRRYWSGELYRIFGMDPEADEPLDWQQFLELVHPDDRERVQSEFERAMEHGVQYAGINRMVRTDGEVRLLECSVGFERDLDGTVCRAVGCCRDVTERELEVERLTQRTLLDPLTGLGNRTLAFDRLAHAMHVAARRGSTVAVLYLDIDGFKQVNDEQGHAAGDEALREVAARIARVVRDSDTLARIGGDEFVVICEDLDRGERAEEIAARLRECFRVEITVAGRARRLAVSVGVALSDGTAATAEHLVAEADAAMYRDKASRVRRS